MSLGPGPVVNQLHTGGKFYKMAVHLFNENNKELPYKAVLGT